MTALTPSTPLDELRSPRGGAVSLEAIPTAGKICLRGEPDDAAFCAGVEKALGAALPGPEQSPLSVDTGLLFWCGPNEWLLHCALDASHGLLAALRESLGDAHAAVVEVSDYYLQLRLAGAGVREVLARHCPLDLHPREFAAGTAVQTRMAKCAVLLHLIDDTSASVQVRWSHAAYLWGLLAQTIEGGAGQA